MGKENNDIIQRFDIIYRRLGDLETHVINLIHPIQDLCSFFRSSNQMRALMELLQQPLQVDDRNLQYHVQTFKNDLHEFEKKNDFRGLTQSIGELKYIAKRLSEIEKAVKIIQKDGMAKDIRLDFSVDGYQLIKKPKEYNSSDPIDEPFIEESSDALNALEDIEKEIVIHRLGIIGTPKTWVAIGKIYNVSRERVRQKYLKAMRKIKHPSRKKLIEKLPEHSKLRKAVFEN